jgi:hypothetical protein
LWLLEVKSQRRENDKKRGKDGEGRQKVFKNKYKNYLYRR